MKEADPFRKNDDLPLPEIVKYCNRDIRIYFQIQGDVNVMENGSQYIKQNINGNRNMVATNNAGGNIESAMNMGGVNEELSEIMSLLEELKQILISQNVKDSEVITDDIELFITVD